MIELLLSKCMECQNRSKDCNGGCFCLLSKKNIMEHAASKECPGGYFEEVNITIENRPLIPKPKQVRTFLQALATGKRVSLEVIQERVDTCTRCEHARKTDKGELWCGECGCPSVSDDKVIQNIAAYEENLPLWGCHHSKRSSGYGWKR